MLLTIAQVDRVLFEGEVYSVNCPGKEGELTVLAHHVPLITTLKRGVIHVRRRKEDQSQEEFPIEHGLLEVYKDGATILL